MITSRLAQAAGLALLFATTVSSAGTPLAARPGAWEITVKTATDGLLIPPSALAKMPPETRARMQAAAKARAGKVDTHVSKSCVTADDLRDDGQWGMNDDEEGACKTTSLNTTPTLRKFQVVCTGDNPRRGEGTFTVVSPTQMNGVMDLAGPGGKLHVEMSGRWLGASCAGIED